MFLVSGTIADSPKRDSKMSAPAMITAVAETLDDKIIRADWALFWLE
jgi:hypothetical protein